MTKKSSSPAFFKAHLPEVLITFFYLVSHFVNLLNLPVFADEAIYIRWSQLIIDDWHRYLFFPLNDGKTPLFIWSLIPLQFLFQNQLFASRVVGVLVGLLQIWVVKLLLKQLNASRRTQLMGMALTTILPFWVTYHRMALMDGLMTLLLSVTLLGILKIIDASQAQLLEWPRAFFKMTKTTIGWSLATGLSFGAALWTKLPALFLAPVFVLTPLFLTSGPAQEKTLTPAAETRGFLRNLLHNLIPLIGALGLGLAIFFSLKLNPAFGQLFGRSKDFSYSIHQVLLEGKWHETLPRWSYYLEVLVSYLTLPTLLIALVGLFLQPVRQRILVLLGAAGTMATPFWLLGKVVYPRYLLPAALFIMLAAVINLDQLISQFVENQTKILHKTVAAVTLSLLISGIVAPSILFMGYSLFDVNHIPFVPLDREQYLQEWSAGQGLPETVAYIQQQAKDHSIAIATEGSFGTLPDGLLLYFHRQSVDNLYIEGIGQPVVSIPEFFSKRAKDFDQIILVVNSHRMKLKLDPTQKIAEYCRPNNAPCLQLWDITPLVKSVATK